MTPGASPTHSTDSKMASLYNARSAPHSCGVTARRHMTPLTLSANVGNSVTHAHANSSKLRSANTAIPLRAATIGSAAGRNASDWRTSPAPLMPSRRSKCGKCSTPSVINGSHARIFQCRRWRAGFHARLHGDAPPECFTDDLLRELSAQIACTQLAYGRPYP